MPTVSEVVDHHPWFGAVLLGMLFHHWYVETKASTARQVVEEILVA